MDKYVLNAKEAASFLSISVSTLYRLAGENSLIKLSFQRTVLAGQRKNLFALQQSRHDFGKLQTGLWEVAT